MKRKIVQIDEDKCDGCGRCADACMEGAIRIVNGKAKLVSDSYCDGLGACLGECPRGAISIIEREAAPFDEEAVKRAIGSSGRPERAHAGEQTHGEPHKYVHPFASAGHVCPGTMARQIKKSKSPSSATSTAETVESELTHWPVQLKLIAPNAPCFQDAHLLLAADCVPFAMADFHPRFLRGRSVVVGCPKLDDAEFYVEKLTEILRQSSVKSLTILHMEVPCCFGLTRIAERAVAASGKNIPVREVTISLDGRVKEER